MADAPIRVSGPINATGLTMSLETGRLAPQANGAVLVQVGNTTLLSTVVTTQFSAPEASARLRSRCGMNLVSTSTPSSSRRAASLSVNLSGK